jgi:hypothetical protein
MYDKKLSLTEQNEDLDVLNVKDCREQDPQFPHPGQLSVITLDMQQNLHN